MSRGGAGVSFALCFFGAVLAGAGRKGQAWVSGQIGGAEDENVRYDPQKARGRRTDAGGNFRTCFRNHRRERPGLSDRGFSDGGLFQGYDKSRDGGADRLYGAVGRHGGPILDSGREGGQAFNRRRRGQDDADRRAGCRVARGPGGEDVGPRAWTHRRDDRQAGVHPRFSDGAFS